MGPFLFKFVQWAPKDASFLQKTAFWPFKVIQGRWFVTNRKRVCDFLLVGHCDYGRISEKGTSTFFSDTATYWLKLPIFPTRCSLCSLRNFVLKLTMRKLKSWGYYLVRPHDRSLSRFGMIPACDRQTVTQSDRQNQS